MLFHAPEFLFVFLPLVLLGYFALGRFSWKGAFAWLALASLVFYGWSAPVYLWFILASILFNYGGGMALDALGRRGMHRRCLLALLVGANLALLGYFKYLVFFAGEANRLFGTAWEVGRILLPIGISFYTFTQIAYLVDVFQDKVRERSFLSYLLFVTYFPHLVAGPVLHPAEMMPQFADRANLRFDAGNFARGLTFLAFGLFKKVVLADGCAPIADAAFASAPGSLGTGEAWLGAVAYALQIYFDFSGYSDMAIGLSLMFNVRLPINFNSPYRATSIIDFWRRWHITLSRFLRDYLYIPLGGNRKGAFRRYANLMVTMLLGGIWHGANWTFLVWGGLHGIYLMVNHGWRQLTGQRTAGRIEAFLYRALTLLAVVVAWVFFRADSLPAAWGMLSAMAGQGGAASTSAAAELSSLGFVAALALWALLAPNTNQLLDYRFGAPSDVPALPARRQWHPRLAYALLVGVLFYSTALIGLSGREELAFLYFQF